MILEPRPGRYRLYGLDSPEAEAVLAEVGITRADLDRALVQLERTEGVHIRSIGGINEDGVFGSTQEGWRPDPPDACDEPFIPLLWLKVHELLGRLPEGQHGAVRQVRHAAGRSSGRRHRRPDGQLKRRPKALMATDTTPPRPRARRRSLCRSGRRQPPLVHRRVQMIQPLVARN